MQKKYNQPSKRKIDFFGGLHGNFLELAVNHAIDKNPYDIRGPQFFGTGACHVKKTLDIYRPITTADHYSYQGQPFADTDLVIRIIPKEHDMLIAITNSFVRAGNQVLDLQNLEHETHNKMSELPKLKEFLQTLVERHGLQDSYSRSTLRHYFHSMFADPACGIDTFRCWLPAHQVHDFEFGSFFALDRFFESLQGIAKFVNIDFVPSADLVALHTEFLEKNQGWHSHNKCNIIMNAIINKISMPMDLNIVEEAWIAWRIAKIFDVYELGSCTAESFAKDTQIIIQEIDEHFQRKQSC